MCLCPLDVYKRQALNQGAYGIFNAILGMVNEQLKAQLEPYAAYGITFSGLTLDGYGEQLDQMAAVFTQKGASQTAAQLAAVKGQLDTCLLYTSRCV